MIEQRVAHRSLEGWRGFALIAAIALLVILGSNFFYALSRWIGNASSLLFILFGMGVAGFLLYRYVMSFVYTCDGSCLRVRRAYGRYQRAMADIWLNGVQACGSYEDMKRRFPAARVQRAVKPECDIAPLAVAYNDAGKVAIMVMQPNDAMRKVIADAVKK